MLMEDSILTTLHISDISPHPDNPRKDLGDLEELSESIAKNGIMQNLTVVPVDEENPDKYICLIGHRRLAAAIMEKLKPLGIKKIPKSETNWKWSGKYDILDEIILDNPKEINIDLKEGETPYAGIQYGSLYICVHKRKTPKQIKTDERERELNRRKKAFKELCKSKYENRRLFIEGIAIGTYKPYANDYAMVERKCWEYVFEHYTALEKTGMWEFLKGTSWYDMKTPEEKKEAVEELMGINKTALMVIACARNAGDGSSMYGWRGGFTEDSNSYLDEQKRIYEILKLYGYQPDDEEKQMLDGTHELYIREE